MKSQILKQLALVALLFSLIIASTSVTAKKPPKDDPPPPPPTEDACETNDSFPSFVFWQPSGSPRNPRQTIYVASQDGTCVQTLVEVPAPGRAFLKYSFAQETGLGRVMWAVNGLPRALWIQDFRVGFDNSIQAFGQPKLILEVPPEISYMSAANLSPTGDRITYSTTSGGIVGIYVRDVSDCIGLSEPCLTDEIDPILTLNEYDKNEHRLWIDHLSWGPVGMRIYVSQKITIASLVYMGSVRILTDSDGEWIDEGRLFTSVANQDYWSLGEVESGLATIDDDRGPREKLAVRHAALCHQISIIDVEDCLTGGDAFCVPEAQFGGLYPSWTSSGTLIHTRITTGRYHVKRTKCDWKDISEWNPQNSEIKPLVVGAAVGGQPDAG
jgi:hypothetical protein